MNINISLNEEQHFEKNLSKLNNSIESVANNHLNDPAVDRFFKYTENTVDLQMILATIAHEIKTNDDHQNGEMYGEKLLSLISELNSKHYTIQDVVDTLVSNVTEHDETADAFDELKFTGYIPAIKRVISSDPATTILFADNTKITVKCDPRDTFDTFYGFLICLAEKAIGKKALFKIHDKLVNADITEYKKPEKTETATEPEKAETATEPEKAETAEKDTE